MRFDSGNGRDQSRPLSILVVDDNEDSAESMARFLTLHRYAVRIALTGEDALRQATEDLPDAVLLDLIMPDLHGWEVARRLRQMACGKRRPYLMAVTGCTTAEDRQRSAEAGIDLHLIKPVNPAMLVGFLWRFARVLATMPVYESGRWHDAPGWLSSPSGEERW